MFMNQQGKTTFQILWVANQKACRGMRHHVLDCIITLKIQKLAQPIKTWIFVGINMTRPMVQRALPISTYILCCFFVLVRI